MKTIFISGATAGIGKATAKLFVAKGNRVIITGRRTEKLNEVADALNQQKPNSCKALCFDVRNRDEVKTAIKQLPQEWKTIDVLVNNAGLAAGKEPLQNGDFKDWDAMIDTNVKGLLYVTEMVLPLMPNGGHVVNVSSIAGLQSYGGGNVYCASKYAVEGLTNGMRIDLLPRNIKVTSICPGLVETEFSMVRFKGDQQKADATYKNIDPLTAFDIAESIYWAVDRPDNVHITQILLMAKQQADALHVNRNSN